MIKELCYRMKEKRASLGYSLEETVEKTKLHPSVIKDIESGDLSGINSAYLKGFIRIYASFLGVDLGTALEELVVKGTSAVAPAPGPNFFSRKIKKISPEVVKKITIILAAAVFLWSFFIFTRFVFRKTIQVFKRKPVSAAQAARPKPQASAASPIVTAPARAQDVSVTLTVKKRTFLRAKVDGNILFEGILNKGAVESWEADKEIEFKISDGSAVELEMNGKALPIISSMRKPIKSLKITSSGITVDK